VQEGVLQAAIAQAFGKTLAAVQRCQLLVGDLDEVAVLARNDALDVAQFRLFHPVQFMLATPQETPEDAAATMDGRAFFAEDKLDGYRAQVHKSGEGAACRVVIYTRTLDRTEYSFPEVAEAVARLPGEFLLDGEIVPYRDGQVLPFAHIQKRLGRKKPPAKVIAENPAAFIAFDILYRDGQLLMDCPLRMRRRELENLAEGGPTLTPSPILMGEGGGEGLRSEISDLKLPTADPHPRPLPEYQERGIKSPPLLLINVAEVSAPGQIAAAFAAARDRRNEGVVLKDPDSCYSPGRRGQAWLKIKTHLPTFDCVVTAAEYGHGRRRNWLSDYTFAVWDRDPALPDAKLVNVGKAYSGVTDEEITQLTDLFHGLSRERFGRLHVVEPKLVLEIACDQIQRSTRHASGYALRFPRIKRVRWDKRPEDADRLERVAEIYQSAPNFARPTGAAVEGGQPSDPKPPKRERAKKGKPQRPAEPTLFD
jgi:DNA ligase-1